MRFYPATDWLWSLGGAPILKQMVAAGVCGALVSCGSRDAWVDAEDVCARVQDELGGECTSEGGAADCVAVLCRSHEPQNGGTPYHFTNDCQEMAEGLMGFDLEVVYVPSVQPETMQEVLEEVCFEFEEDSRAITLECNSWWEEIYTGPEEYFGAPYMVGCYYHE